MKRETRLTIQPAKRVRHLEQNAVREILKAVSAPGMLSLAGGIPAPETMPVDMMPLLLDRALSRWGAGALQYDITEGFPPFRETVAHLLEQEGIRATPDTTLISSGSQGMLDALGKTLISPGDAIVVEAPTYLGALSAFAPYGPSYIPLEMDQDGAVPDSLEEKLRRQPVKFIYLVPNFQNPSGRTLPLARRERIAELARKYQTLVVEDDPYGKLRYEGAHLPSICSLAPDHTVYLSSLSKVFAPGLRLGFCAAPPDIRRWLTVVKQGVDLHTGTLSQALATEYIQGGHLDAHLPRIISLYAPRCQAMQEALELHFPKEFRWSRPEGGMFLWVEGPEELDMKVLYYKALERKVAFVPGSFFFTEPEAGAHTMRLNFTMCPEEDIRRAIRILGEVLAEAAATA